MRSALTAAAAEPAEDSDGAQGSDSDADSLDEDFARFLFFSVCGSF